MAEISALVFDLDGTLYKDRRLEEAIQHSALRYLAKARGVGTDAAAALLKATKERLGARGKTATLSHSIIELGADLRALHAHFAADIHPEEYLTPDDRVVSLLKELARHYELHVYTNNNLRLASNILEQLGIDGMFRHVFTIEDTWRPKPDQRSLEYVFDLIGLKPGECLFIGDRYEIDLQLPHEMGSAVSLVGTTEELLSLTKLLAVKQG